MTLKEMLATIKEVADDLTSLDVVTLTGEITIKSSLVDGKIKLNELYKAIEAKADVEGALEVVAFTHIDFDCDSTNFVKTGAAEGEAMLLKAHNDMVSTAQETRQGYIKMVADTIGI